MSLKNKSLEIERISFSRLLKLEVPQLAEEVIGIVEKHEPESLQIKPVFDLLVAKKPIISKLKVPYGIDPVRLELKPLREKLSLKASAIKLHLRLLSKSTDPNDLHLVKTTVNRHLQYLNRSKNTKVLNQKIAQFIEEVETDAALNEAMRDFGFMELVGKLELALADVRAMEGKRVSLLSQRPQEPAKQLINAVVDAIVDLFKEIEVAQLRLPELDFAPLVYELNALLKQYRITITLRDARNKRNANNEEPVDESGELIDELDEPTAEATSTEVQSMVGNGDASNKRSELFVASIENGSNTLIEKVSGNGLNGELAQSLDQKKTVVETTNQTQQPFESSGSKA